MLNKLGQKYHCSVPLLEDESNSLSGGSSSGEASSQTSEEKRDSKVDIYHISDRNISFNVFLACCDCASQKLYFSNLFFPRLVT